MNIDGLSEATLEKFIAKGFIHDFGDIFEIEKHRKEILEMDGFGEKSFENLLVSLEKARETTLAKVIYSLGISNIGLANAKVICRHFDDDLEKFAVQTRRKSAPLIQSALSLQRTLRIISERKKIIESWIIFFPISI